MGKRLWRKHSYVGVENDDPGCIWAFFRILSYHNVKRMLPSNNKKEKPLGKRKVKPKHHQICPPYELEEDPMKMNSASVELSTSVVGLVKKKSVKAKIKALLVADEDKSKEVDLLQQSQLKVLEHNCKHLSAPTLISLLRANPKPTSNPKHVEESSKLKPKNGVGNKDSKEEQVGVLEVFRVNQDLFLKVLKDSPPRKLRLAKSRTFPSPNNSHILFPSKVENKHNEIWPVISHGRELKKSKSQRMGRSSSLKESLDRYAPLFDTKSNKEIKKGLSRSFRLTNEKEFALLGYHHIRRSSKERLSFLETDFYIDTPQTNLETLNLNQTHQGEVKGMKFDSPRDVSVLDQIEALAQSHLGGKSNLQEEKQIGQMTIELEARYKEVQNSVCPVWEDSSIVFHNNEDSVLNFQDHYSEELQYVKYVLDLMGFTAGEDPYGAWYSVDQPLDPALFDAIEVCCPFEPSSSEKEAVDMSSNHRKVLFDMINEALVYVHERSYVCYPKALSYSCHVRPMPKGKNRVVEEVWEFMSQYLKCRQQLDPVLNLAMPLKLSEEGPGWMNLQTYSECLALFLEDLIFDELLDEVVCC